MSKILITGGSGLLGKAISEILLKNNEEVVWLSRKEGFYKGIKKYKWDIDAKFIDERAFENVEHIIHLAGAGIADKKWSLAYKTEIINSRVKSSALVYDYVKKLNLPLKTLVGASGVGFYGARCSQDVITELEGPFNDFLATTCVSWENSYKPFNELGIRTPIIRTGVVLSKNGGAYKKMILPFKFNLGCSLGSGKQYFPWIHINDIASIFVYALKNEAMTGIYNATASEQVTMNTFCKQLVKSINRFTFLPNIPTFALKLVMGEGYVMLTEGLKINNKKIINEGFKFQFEKLSDALSNIANKTLL
jgi:uncharacterized protein (TIGR01777 family)